MVTPRDLFLPRETITAAQSSQPPISQAHDAIHAHDYELRLFKAPGQSLGGSRSNRAALMSKASVAEGCAPMATAAYFE